MPYIRLTLAHPRPELRAEVERHYWDLAAYARTLPGCLGAYALATEDAEDEIGRLSIWESPEAADHAANDPHSLALHAQLLFDLQGVFWDHSFKTMATAMERNDRATKHGQAHHLDGVKSAPRLRSQRPPPRAGSSTSHRTRGENCTASY